MKKLMTVFLLVLMAAIAFGQATPVGVIRIANATTAFGINLPIGSIVVNIATNTQWQANAGVVSTATLTTASSSFVQINATSATNLSTGSNTSTAINITSSTGTAATLNSATSTLAGLESAADNVKLGQLSTTALQTYTFPSSSATIPANNQGFYIGTTQVHINDASGTTTSLGINITGSSASCTGNAATATNLAGGLGGSIPYQTAVNTTAMLANGTSGQALLSAGGTAAPTWGTPWTSANTTGTSGGLSGSALSGDVTNAGNAITIASGAVTLGKMANLAANSFIGNNTGSPATPIALTKSQMIVALNVNRASENFENAADSLSGTTTVHLANTPQAGTITVILNGFPLTSTQYGVDQTTHVVIFSSCYKYDKIAVAYSY